MIKIQENMYLVAPTAILGHPMPLSGWEKLDDNGDIIEGEYYSINEYLATYGHTVERFNNDGSMFAKGFNWTVSKIDEVREGCVQFGLVYNETLFILNRNELEVVLNSEGWSNVDNN